MNRTGLPHEPLKKPDAVPAQFRTDDGCADREMPFGLIGKDDIIVRIEFETWAKS